MIMRSTSVADGLFAALVTMLVAVSVHGQSPVEFSASQVQSGVNYESFTVADVLGSPHPEVIYQVGGGSGGLFIADRHAPGAPQVVNFGTVTDPIRAWAVGDVNQDGQTDIVALSNNPAPNASAIRIFSSSGAAFNLTTIADPGAQSIHLADIDGNGWPDLVVGPRVRFNFGGSFSPAVILPSAALAEDTQTGDFDGDGDIDFVGISRVASNGTLLIQPIRNDGGQTFTAVNSISISGAYFIADVGRMNGDLRDDLVLLYSSSGRLRCRSMLGNTQGTLSVKPLFELYGTISVSGDLDVADLDGDGFGDVVASFKHPYYGASLSCILMNTGAGQFAAGTGKGLMALQAKDIGRFKLVDEDLDGDPDIIGGLTNSAPAPVLAINTSFNVPPTPLGPTTFIPLFAPQPAEIALGSTAVTTYRLTLANGSYLRSKIVTINFTSPTGSTPNPKTIVCDDNGYATFDIEFGNVAGQVTWTLTSADGDTYSDYAVSTPTLSIVSGDGQSFCAGTNLSEPLVVRVLSYTGQPVAGLTVGFGDGQNPIASVPSDSMGFASVSAIIATNPPGPKQVFSWLSSGSSVTFHVNAIPPIIATTSGSGQVTRAGTAFAQPLSVNLVDCSAGPIPTGSMVNFASGNPGLTISASSATTDATGTASITATASPTAAGPVIVTASLAGAPVATFDLYVRSFRSFSIPSPHTLYFVYNHEHSGAALLLAADLPLPAPGAITTPFGDIHTSILNPAPTLSVIDGLGLFGPPEPEMTTVANGSWTRTLLHPPTPLGLTLVAELYGYDPSYPGLEAYFISNPITVNL